MSATSERKVGRSLDISRRKGDANSSKCGIQYLYYIEVAN